MQQLVQVLPLARRALRRAVEIPCQVVSPYWDEPVEYVATELSPVGMWIDTPYPLSLGDPLVVRFERPPPAVDITDERDDRVMFLLARVRRVELRRREAERRRSGMGIEFVGVTDQEVDVLAESLHGIPPPLPQKLADDQLASGGFK